MINFSRKMENFIQEIKIHKGLIGFWLFTIILFILWIYPGDESSFLWWFNDYALTDGIEALRWNQYTYHHVATFILFFLLPMIYIVFVSKKPLQEYGLRIGDWKWGAKTSFIGMILVTPFVYTSSFDPAFLKEYPLSLHSMESSRLFIQWCAFYLLYYIGWEFVFRGFLLHELKNTGFINALFIQTAISTILHIGKPAGETWGALFGGLFMGWLAWRSRSVLWPFLFHAYVGILNSYLCGIQHLKS